MAACTLPLFVLLGLCLASSPTSAARVLGDTAGTLDPMDEARSTPAGAEAQSPRGQQSHAGQPPLGLPRECMTYEERYRRHQYHAGLPHSTELNAQHRHSKLVVLLKLHRVFEDRWPLDLILNIRAMASEVTEAGYHFYVLFQPPIDNGFTFFASGRIELTREEVLEFLPPDLRPFVIVHSYDDDYKLYHALSSHDTPGVDIESTWGPGPRAAYVATSRFMQRYRAYEYAWVVEYDVRWTGSSWGEVLNAALDLGRQATEEELDAHPIRLVNASRPASRALPASTEGLPDLLTFGYVAATDKWREKLNHMGEAQQLYAAQATIYLGSRRLWDAVHEYSNRGVGAHLEIALPTVAMQQRLKVAAIELPPHPSHSRYHHCCTPDAGEIYSGWYNDSNACAPSLLMHPVKTREEFWPSVPLDLDS